MLNQNVIDFGELYGCIHCGTAFVPKETREFVRENIRELLQESEKPTPIYNKVENGETFSCKCGKEAKSKAGLAAHQRVCQALKLGKMINDDRDNFTGTDTGKSRVGYEYKS